MKMYVMHISGNGTETELGSFPVSHESLKHSQQMYHGFVNSIVKGGFGYNEFGGFNAARLIREGDFQNWYYLPYRPSDSDARICLKVK